MGFEPGGVSSFLPLRSRRGRTFWRLGYWLVDSVIYSDLRTSSSPPLSRRAVRLLIAHYDCNKRESTYLINTYTDTESGVSLKSFLWHDIILRGPVLASKEWNRYRNIAIYWLLGDMSIAARPIRYHFRMERYRM